MVAGREPVTGGFILLGISFKASLPQSAELTTAQKVTNMLIYEQLSEDWEWRQHTHHLTEFLSLNNEYFQNATGALLLILLITTHLIKAGSFLEQLVISGGLFSIEKIYKSVIAFLSFFFPSHALF